MNNYMRSFLLVTIASLLQVTARAQWDEATLVGGQEIFLRKNISTQLASFLICRAEGKIYLAWVTRGRQCEGTFVVYRSADGENFGVLGIVQASKTPDENGTGYSFIDEDPGGPAPPYYKIVHLGINNSFLESGPVKVRSASENFANSVK